MAETGGGGGGGGGFGPSPRRRQHRRRRAIQRKKFLREKMKGKPFFRRAAFACIVQTSVKKKGFLGLCSKSTFLGLPRDQNRVQGFSLPFPLLLT